MELSGSKGYCGDQWPVMPDGDGYDGRNLLKLTRSGNSPFRAVWDVNLLIQEIEENLHAKVTKISDVCDHIDDYVSFCLQSSYTVLC
jgi:hypothetical protein